jgi:hypothetical protein
LFDDIKRKDRDTYLVHAHCKKGDKASFEGEEEFQLVNGLLFKKRAAMITAVLWVLLVFVYLPTPHWGVASIEFPYSDTSGNRAPMVSTFTTRNECLAGRKEVKEELEGMVRTDHQDPHAVFGVDRNMLFDEDGNTRPHIWRHEPRCIRFLRAQS